MNKQIKWAPGDRALCNRTEGLGHMLREGRLYYVFDVAKVPGCESLGLFLFADSPMLVLPASLFTHIRPACNRGLYPNERDV